MSDNIPFEIQTEIINKFPVKSLLRFRTVSKQWKSLIDCPEFIKNYHINRTNPCHHLLVWYGLEDDRTYISIMDDNTFPQHKFPLTAPESLNLLTHTVTLGCPVNGLICFYGDLDSKTTPNMAVIWNPSIRKSVSIAIPNVFPFPRGYITTAFGVCPDTSDPKLVRIRVDKSKIPASWVVEVFSLSTRVWKTVYMGTQFKSCDQFLSYQVCIDGIIYWCALGKDEGIVSNCVISFDLKREKFGEVSLSDRLAHTCDLVVAKVNESLGLLEYYNEGEKSVCGVWTRKDGVNKPFTNIYTVKVEGTSALSRVLGFRNNGEVVLVTVDDDNDTEFAVEVYEPSSGHINGVGIKGKYDTFSTRSYIETLLLLHESNSVIHG